MSSPVYNALVDRTDAAADLPREIAEQIVGAIAKESTALSLGHQVPTTTRDSRIPVLTSAPDAYWISSDTGMKQTSAAVWSNESLIAEEIATIVPIPDSVIADSEFALWDALRPLLARAMARRLDKAVLFGIEKPSTWGLSMAESAIAAGNIAATTAGPADPVGDLLAAAELVGDDGYPPNGAVVRPGWQFKAARLRTYAFSANPIGADQPFPLSVAGLGISTDPVFWDRTAAEAIVADWSNVLIGLRSDIKVEIFNSGVISDDTGKVVMNLMQQDTSAMRATMRVGFLLANPITNVDGSGTRCPVAVVQPLASGS